MGGGPVHQVVLVRHHDRPVSGGPERFGHRLEGGPQRGVMIGAGVGGHPAVGQTVRRPVRLAPPEVERAHHQAGGTRQGAGRVGGPLRVAVGELHPGVQSVPLAQPQNAGCLLEGIGPAHSNRA